MTHSLERYAFSLPSELCAEVRELLAENKRLKEERDELKELLREGFQIAGWVEQGSFGRPCVEPVGFLERAYKALTPPEAKGTLWEQFKKPD